MKSSYEHAKEYAVVLSTLSEHTKCTDLTDKVAYLVDNHYNGICVQIIDRDKDMDKEEEVILNLF